MLVNVAFSQTQQKIANDKSKSTITYSASHPLHDWDGESKEVKAVIMADETKTKIFSTAISVKVSTFNSGNANRDSHMIEVTEAIKYPAITFASTSISQTGNKLKVTGNMKFHNVTKVVTTTAEMKTINNHIIVAGEFDLKMTDFKIERPSLMGMPTADELKIKFDLTF